MIKPFHFLVKSLTEFAAAKAALAQHGIGVGSVIESVVERHWTTYGTPTNLGNYSRPDGKAQNYVAYHGYRSGPYLGGVALASLSELIAFLEAGDYKEKPKKFKVALTKVEIVEVEAFTEEEAKAKALQTKCPVIKTSTTAEIAR